VALNSDPADDPLLRLDRDEAWRREQFPACREGVFLAHAAVAPVPSVAVEAMAAFNAASATGELDYGEVLVKEMDGVRAVAADFLGVDPAGVALLGPTSLGLSLVANGIDWRPGDEVVAYLDDYPANVYPWQYLETRGVKTVFLRPERPGELTPELVEDAITPATRLLALASCHFLTGYRLDVAEVGRIARERGVLFCLDAIQTAGAFPVDAEHVDFLSADSHKWLLGPLTAGVFYVRPERFEELRPTLLGAWNVKCPGFVAQGRIEYEDGARRYEPGVLNAPGLCGMKASIELLASVGIDRIAERLLALKEPLVAGLEEIGFEIAGPRSGPSASGITTATLSSAPERVAAAYRALSRDGVATSLRHDRAGRPHLRFSPHFYNTPEDIERALGILAQC